MTFDFSVDPMSRDILFHGRIPETEILRERMVQAIAQEVVRQIAEVIVLEKSTEVMSRIDVNAIANMVIAQAAADISATVTRKLSA